ncbi:MAG TPA: methyltransferase domain-containing protein [Anaerolineae bacterium]|nr:methyltransferase domain-containing protein [Anaerolineae bacterium]
MKKPLFSSQQEIDDQHQALIARLKRQGAIRTHAVEAAMRSVPRHMFVPLASVEKAYQDQVIPIKEQGGKWVSSASQPTIVAWMLETLSIKPGHRVLEIGTGTGYNAALLGHLVGPTGQVVSVDIDNDIVQLARRHLARTQLDWVQTFVGDGGYGYAHGAPYDRIISTVGVNDVTPAWRAQLGQNGRLLIPFQITSLLEATILLRRSSDEKYLYSSVATPSRFISLRGDFATRGHHERKLKGMAGLQLWSQQPLTQNSEAIDELLASEWEWLETGLTVTPVEVWSGLRPWLALGQRRFALLVAPMKEGVETTLPFLLPESKQAQTTFGLLGRMHATFFGWGAGEGVVDSEGWGEERPLSVCSYGRRDWGVRLVEAAQAWAAAGRPTVRDLELKVYPKDSEVHIEADEMVLHKPWSTVVAKWGSK